MEEREILQERKDYITLSLPALQQTDSGSPKYSRSLHRRWNQLARLQRVVIVMLGLLGLIALYYLFLQKDPLEETHSSTAVNLLEEQNVTPLLRVDNLEEHNEAIVQNDRNAEENNEHKPPEQHQIPPPTRRTPRQEAVVAAMKHAWKGYKTYAWGHDHLKPISRSRHDWFNLGLTLVDALDTLWVMDLKDEFEEAKEWVRSHLNFNINQEVNLFETTIRVLGGLLSSYHLSNDKIFLDKAIDLADRLLAAFNTESGVPYSDVNLATRRASKPKWGPDSSTSEVTTIQLEFRDLSRITGNPIYAEKVGQVSKHIHTLPKTDGLVPIFINAQSGSWRPHSTITLGARGDTYYEYLLKQWIQYGKTEDYLRNDYNESILGMSRHLAARTHPSKMLFFGELHGSSKNFINKMDELTCFLPGTLILGHHYGMPEEHLSIAKELVYTCVMTWLKQPTNLAPEITYFNIEKSMSGEDFYVKSNDAHYLLRPETVESLWYMFHLTGNTTYQDWGWQIFRGIEKYCKVDHGYTIIGNVRSVTDTKPRDKMESYFLGETLKYFYLLFADDQKTYNVDKWVLNSEAHFLPIYND